LFDHIVGTRRQAVRHFEAERLRDLEVIINSNLVGQREGPATRGRDPA
jgi:hypothetical protein